MKRLTPEQQREARRQPVKRPGRASPAKIREIMIEKSETPYILLLCDHYTHKEEIERNACWQPTKGVYWCDKCKFWTAKKPKIKAGELPEKPPF